MGFDNLQEINVARGNRYRPVLIAESNFSLQGINNLQD
jgi:hypothetical protein